jgi:hypothetical protein
MLMMIGVADDHNRIITRIWVDVNEDVQTL